MEKTQAKYEVVKRKGVGHGFLVTYATGGMLFVKDDMEFIDEDGLCLAPLWVVVKYLTDKVSSGEFYKMEKSVLNWESIFQI